MGPPPMSHNVPLKTTCKATFVGTCYINGSISENYVLSCARDLIRECSDYLNWTVSIDQHELRMVLESDPASTGSQSSGVGSAGSSLASCSGNSSDSDSDKEQGQPRPSTSRGRDEFVQQSAVTTRAVPLSRILFAQRDGQFSNVITWILTKNYATADTGRNNGLANQQLPAGLDNINNAISSPDGQADDYSVGSAGRFERETNSTELLVWECVDEQSTALLHETYRSIRSRKKLNKIEAIAKARTKHQITTTSGITSGHHQLQSEKAANPAAESGSKLQNNELRNHSNQGPSSVMVNDRPPVSSNGHPLSPWDLQALGLISHDHLRPIHQQMLAASLNKTHCRQRHPALLLQPTKLNGNGGHRMLSRQQQQQLVQQQQAIAMTTAGPSVAAYWVNPFPAESSTSEFDPSRFGRYAMNFSPSARSAQQAYHQTTVSSRRQRSKSVDATLSRQLRHAKNSINGTHLKYQHQHQHVATVYGIGAATANRHPLVVTRSESLGSDSASTSGDDSDGIRGVSQQLFSSLSLVEPPPKSALKKASSLSSSPPLSAGLNSATGSQLSTFQPATAASSLSSVGSHHQQQHNHQQHHQYLGGKKNSRVTFSAFATIQLMDK